MVKKGASLFLVSLIFSFYLINLVSAYVPAFDPRTQMERTINLVVDFAEPVLRWTLGGDVWDGRLLFEKFLLFVIILGVCYISLKNVPAFQNQNKALWIIVIVVSILSVRYIDISWIYTVAYTYAAFGIAVTTLVPFIIFFLFISGVNLPSAMRKVAWILFAVVYLGLWTTSQEQTYSEWYFVTAVLALIFLFLDGTIRRAMIKSRMEQLGFDRREHYEIVIRRQLQQNEEDFNTHHIITAEQYNRIKHRLQKQLENLQRN